MAAASSLSAAWAGPGAAGDLAVAAALGCAISCVSYALRRHAFSRLGDRLGLVAPAVRDKFEAELWALTWHVAMVAWELVAVAGEPWFHASLSPWTAPGGTRAFWPPRGTPVAGAVRLLYLVQIGYLAADSLAMYLKPNRNRKEVAMFVAHHLAALLLVLVSYFPPPCRFVFMGSGILLLHEVSDVFLYAAKISKFYERRALAAAFLVATTLTWGWLRVASFPRIIFSAATESDESSPRQVACVVMLSLLWVLHVEWFRMLLVVLWRGVAGGGLNDPTRPDYREEGGKAE